MFGRRTVGLFGTQVVSCGGKVFHAHGKRRFKKFIELKKSTQITKARTILIIAFLNVIHEFCTQQVMLKNYRIQALLTLANNNLSVSMEQKPKMNGVIFKQSFTKDIEEKLLGLNEAALLQQKQLRVWVSISGLHDQHQLIQIFSYIEQLMCLKLSIVHNNYPALIKGISLPCFSQLKILDLRFNVIYSIEALAFMDMESIELVDLSDNRVNQLKALNKTRWPMLHSINFTDSRVIVCNLERVKMSQKLQKIMYRGYSNNGFLHSQRVNLVKLEPSFICQRFHRMMDNPYAAKVCQILAKKYSPIQ